MSGRAEARAAAGGGGLKKKNKIIGFWGVELTSAADKWCEMDFWVEVT